MRRFILRLVLLSIPAACALASRTQRADAIPDYLVGEWTDSSSEWHGDTLARGKAVYIDHGGRFTILGAPPLIRISGALRYDRATHRVALAVENGLTLIALGPFHYDPRRRILIGGDAREGVLPMHRRRVGTVVVEIPR